MDFKVTSGVCRPQTAEVLGTFKGIQRETNRMLDLLKKKPLLYVDGRIGSGTVKGVNKALNGGYKNCSEIANQSKQIHGILKQQADARSAPIVADPESIVRKTFSPPSTVGPSGQIINPNLSTAGIGGVPLWLVAVAGVGGIYYFKKTKGGKKQWKSLTKGF